MCCWIWWNVQKNQLMSSWRLIFTQVRNSLRIKVSSHFCKPINFDILIIFTGFGFRTRSCVITLSLRASGTTTPLLCVTGCSISFRICSITSRLRFWNLRGRRLSKRSAKWTTLIRSSRPTWSCWTSAWKSLCSRILPCSKRPQSWSNYAKLLPTLFWYYHYCFIL